MHWSEKRKEKRTKIIFLSQEEKGKHFSFSFYLKSINNYKNNIKIKNSNPEKFLDTQELSALENETLKGGKALTKNKDHDAHECNEEKCSTHS